MTKVFERSGEIALLIVLASTLLFVISQYNIFSAQVFVIVILLSMSIFIIVVYGFLGQRISDFIKRKLKERKDNELANKCFEEFKEFVDRFGENVKSGGHSDNIPYVLSNFLRHEKTGKVNNISIPDYYMIDGLFHSFKQQINRFDGTKEDFSIIIKQFDQMIRIYNELYVCNPVNEIIKTGISLPDYTKHEYSKYRNRHTLFIEEYMQFNKKVNKIFGERICIYNFDIPKELKI